MTENEAYIEIDLKKMVKALWKKAWLIVLAAVVFGIAAFGATMLAANEADQSESSNLPVYYTASAVMYARKLDDAGTTTPNELAKTAAEVVYTHSVLDEVIERGGLNYNYETLASKISVKTLNGTGVFKISATGSNAERTALIVNTVTEVLPEKAAAVIANGEFGVIDTAPVPVKPNSESVSSQADSPSPLMNAAVAAVLGALLVCAAVIVKELYAAWKAASAA